MARYVKKNTVKYLSSPIAHPSSYGLGGDIGKALSIAGKSLIGAQMSGLFDLGTLGKSSSPFYTVPAANTSALDATAQNMLQSAQSNIPKTFAAGGQMYGAVGSAVGDVANTIISNGYSSNGGSIINGIGDLAANIPGPWGAIASAGLKTVGGLTNAAFGSKTDEKLLSAAKTQTNALSKFTSNASSFDDVRGPSAVSNVGEVYKGGWFAKGAAAKKNNELQQARQESLDYAHRNVQNNINNLSKTQMDSIASSYAANGGYLNRNSPHNPYYYALGGNMDANGTEWSDGVTQINNGGTHEQNPYNGVPMGMNSEGQYNLVEEGEVVYNDYVYSNRLTPSKEIRELYKLDKGATFADAVKKAEKEIEERPNDPISNRGFKQVLEILKQDQEAVRAKEMIKQQINEGINPYGDLQGMSSDGMQGTPQGYSEDLSQGYSDYMQQGLPQGMSPYNEYATQESAEGTPETSYSNVTYGDGGDIQSKTYDKPLNTAIRNAPIWGSALGVATSFIPTDYSNADRIQGFADLEYKRGNVSYKPIGDYMTYRPFDINYTANQLRAAEQAGARRLVNNSGGNRGIATAGLLSNAYNSQIALGDAYRKAFEYNAAQRKEVADFNRATNLSNSQMGLDAAKANQDFLKTSNASRTQASITAAQMRQSIADNKRAQFYGNLTNLFTNLGNLGNQNWAFNTITKDPSRNFTVGPNGVITFTGNNANVGTPTKATSQAYGGMLTINKRKRKR